MSLGHSTEQVMIRNSSDRADHTEKPVPTGRATYLRPVVLSLGTLAELTRGSGGGGVDAGDEAFSG